MMSEPSRNRTGTILFLSFLAFGAVAALLPVSVAAHCDTLDGPVVADARLALEKGEVTPVLKWVQPGDETEIRQAFKEALAVRSKGPEAKELADRYFFETLVRVHRAGEGAPYTGLKPAGSVDPGIAAADKALESGSVAALQKLLGDATASGLAKRYARVIETRKHKDESVGAGREFVEAYVTYVHYAEGLLAAAEGGAAHGGETSEAHEAPAPREPHSHVH